MKPKTAIITITILILILALILIKIPTKVFHEENRYIHTKAICNDSNYCEDYVIECSEKEKPKITATGLAIQKPSNWKDPRKNPGELCN